MEERHNIVSVCPNCCGGPNLLSLPTHYPHKHVDDKVLQVFIDCWGVKGVSWPPGRNSVAPLMKVVM